MNNITLSISGRKETTTLIFGSQTFGKGIGIQALERDGWKRTVVGALSILNDRKEVTIVSNEPGHVATAGKRIWIQFENVKEILYDVKDERVKEYTFANLNLSDRRLDRHHLLQNFLKDVLFKHGKFIGTQIDKSHREISYRHQ